MSLGRAATGASAGRAARRAAPAAVLLAAALTAGCALRPSLSYDPLAAPSVHLPLAKAGIADQRPAFAARLQAELAQDAAAGASTVLAEWLHPVPAADPRAARRAAPPMPDLSTVAVLVVPGLFGECVDDQALPFTDGRVRDRRLAYTTAYEAQRAALGAHSVAAVRLAGRGSAETNAVAVASAIAALQDDPAVTSIVLVAYSKGAADTLHALALLQREGRVPAKPMALASVAGAVMGTPIADRYAPLYTTLQGLIDLDACPGSDGADFDSLTRAYRSQWLADAMLPPQVAMYSLVAHAPRALVAPGLRPFYDLLALADPRNDGQLIASDAILPGSTLLAELRSDHWDLAVPLSRSPNPLLRSITSGREFPRDSLFRAIVRHVAGDLAQRATRKPAG